MSIQEQLKKYLSDFLNINSDDIKKIQIHKDLRKLLKEKLEFKGNKEDEETYSFLTGSYVRNTAIRPPKDVDFFIVLNEQKYGNLSPIQLLELLEKTLKDIIPDKTIFQQSHSATIEYDEEFGIDVIPAFEVNEKVYKIPEVVDSNESWLKSNPKIHKEKLTEANESSNDNLVPIVKLLKAWKRDKCDFIKSFHLELLAVEILNNSKIENYASGLNVFFSNAKNYIDSPCLLDPANNQNYVDSYLGNDERKKFKNIITKEKETAQRAVELENNGNMDSAIAEWDKIFTFNPEKKKFIGEKYTHEKQLQYPENLQYKIKITAKLFNPTTQTYKENYYSNSRKLPKGWKLKFHVDITHVPSPLTVYWQVVNTGREAELANDLRGNLLLDEGKNIRYEHTKYKGTHYMNCFIVKNNVCIAKDRFSVQIR